jgi:hypothetical protein
MSNNHGVKYISLGIQLAIVTVVVIAGGYGLDKAFQSNYFFQLISIGLVLVYLFYFLIKKLK